MKRGVEVKRALFLVIFATLVIGLALFGLSDTVISVSGASILNTEAGRIVGEAYDSTSTASIAITLIKAVLLIGFLAWAIYAISKKIRHSVQGRREKKWDETLRSDFAEFDFNREKKEIQSIGSRYVPSQHICPRCGGMLVLMTRRDGRFLGCNHHPECAYSRRIE